MYIHICVCVYMYMYIYIYAFDYFDYIYIYITLILCNSSTLCVYHESFLTGSLIHRYMNICIPYCL